MLNNNKPHSNMLKNFSLYILLVIASDVSCHQCYICGPAQLGFKRNCDHFNSNPELHAEECQATYLGCSTQIYDDKITRQCEEHKINDCKIANGVNYCYCAMDLCNGVNLVKAIPSDDEDMFDGSGLGKVDETTIIPNVQLTSTATNFYSTFTLMIASILLH